MILLLRQILKLTICASLLHSHVFCVLDLFIQEPTYVLYVPVLESKSNLVPILVIMGGAFKGAFESRDRGTMLFFISAGERWGDKCENVKLGIGGESFSLREKDTLEPERNIPLYEKVLQKHNQWVLGEDFQKIWNRGNYGLVGHHKVYKLFMKCKEKPY